MPPKRKTTNAPAHTSPTKRPRATQQTTSEDGDEGPNRRQTRSMTVREAGQGQASGVEEKSPEIKTPEKKFPEKKTAKKNAPKKNAPKKNAFMRKTVRARVDDEESDDEESDDEGSSDESTHDHVEQTGVPPQPPKTIHDLPQELWDTILFGLWSLPGCAQWDHRPPQWLSSCRLVSREFHRRSNDTFIKRNFSVLKLQLTANDPAAPSTTREDVSVAMQIMDRLQPDNATMTIEHYVKTIWFEEPRVRDITAPLLSLAASMRLRTHLILLRTRCNHVEKLIFEDNTSLLPPNGLLPYSNSITLAARRFTRRPLPTLTSLTFRGCRFADDVYIELFRFHRSLTHLEFTNLVLLHEPSWTPILAYIRHRNHSGHHLTSLQLQSLYATVQPATTPPTIRLIDYACVSTVPRPIRTFRNPWQVDPKLQVESFVLGNRAAGSRMKGRFAVELGLNQLVGPQSVLYRAGMTVEGYKARGWIV